MLKKSSKINNRFFEKGKRKSTEGNGRRDDVRDVVESASEREKRREREMSKNGKNFSPHTTQKKKMKAKIIIRLRFEINSR